jgi:hypothetical protein
VKKAKAQRTIKIRTASVRLIPKVARPFIRSNDRSDV